MRNLFIYFVMVLLFSSYTVSALNYNTDTQFATFIDWTNNITATQDMVGSLDLVTNVGGTTINTTNFYIDFNGIDNRLEFPAVNFTVPFTYSFLVNVDVVAADKDFMGKYLDTSNRLWTFSSNTDWDLRTISSVNGNTTDSTSAVASSDSTWYLITVIDNGSTIKQYIDTTEVTSGVSRGSHINTAQLIFGGNGVLGGRFLDGKESQFYLFNKALNTSELTTHYNNVYTNRSFNPFKAINTNIQPYYNLENISINISTLSNVSLNYSLDGGANQTIWTNQNNGTLNLYNLSIGSHTIIFYDNESNILTETFTYQPYQYFYFTNSTGGTITNFQLDGISYVNYANFTAASVGLGEHEFTFSKTGFETTTFNRTFTINTQLNETIQVPFTKIIVSIYDKDTSNIITGLTTLTLVATQGANATTTTGYYNFTNENFINENYQIIAEHTGYSSETVYFTYDNQETIIVDIYMINSSSADYGTINIKTIDSLSFLIEGVTISSLEWNPSTSSYVNVGQCQTNVNGICTLNIQLNNKLYKFQATKDSVTKTTNSQIITTDASTLTIQLESTTSEVTPIYNNINANFSETLSGNLSTTRLQAIDILGNSLTACIYLYKDTGFSQTLLDSNCSTSTSSIIKYYTTNINNTYDIVIKGYVISGSNSHFVDEFRHASIGNIADTLNNYNLDIYLPIIFLFLAIATGIYFGNAYIVLSLIIILEWIAYLIVPTIITSSVAVVFTVICGLMFWGINRK